MLLISKFHDYYDSALAGGVDKTIVYRRNTKEIERPDWMKATVWFPELVGRSRWSGNYVDYTKDFSAKMKSGLIRKYELKVFIIGFCGKAYKGVRLSKDSDYSSEYQPTYHYTSASIELEMQRLGIKYRDKDVNCFDFTPKECIQMVDAKYVSFSSFGEYSFGEYRYGTNYLATINPILKEFKFYRAVDTYTAFQEIAMYISGVIGTGENNTITISDKDMRDAKGFDDWSFKNPTRVKDLP